MKDVWHRRKPREYLSKIIREYWDIEMTTDFALITVIYSGFHLQFKGDLLYLSTTTSINTYLQTIDNCKIVWCELASEDKIQGYSQGSSMQRPKK